MKNTKEIQPYIQNTEEVAKIIGRIEAATVFREFATVAGLVWLKEVKDQKLYKEIGCSWETFCQRLGISRRTIDEQLQNLTTFGEQFMEAASRAEIGYREIRQLRGMKAVGAVVIEGDLIKTADQVINITTKSSEEIKSLIETIIEEKSQTQTELEEERKTRDKIITEETKGLKIERKALVDRVKELEGRIPDLSDPEKIITAFSDLKNQALRFVATCRRLMQAGEIAVLEDRVAQGELYGLLEMVDGTFQDLRYKVDEMIGG